MGRLAAVVATAGAAAVAVALYRKYFRSAAAAQPPRRGSLKHDSFVEKCRSTYIQKFMSSTFYDAKKAPDGVVDMGVAQNKISAAKMRERMERCKIDLSPEFMGGCDPMAYGPMHGLPRLRKAFAQALERYVFKSDSVVDPDADIMVNNGATSTFALLASVLCDPGSGSFMLINPRYPGFQTDITGYANVECVPVTPSTLGELPTDAELEAAYSGKMSRQ